MPSSRLVPLLTLPVFVASCATVEPNIDTSSIAENKGRKVNTLSPDEWGEWGIDLSTLDSTVQPGEDFYRFVNGTWLSTFQLPKNKSLYGAGSIAAEKARQHVGFIVEDLTASNAPASTTAGKIALFHQAFIDQKVIETRGLEPAQSYLGEISEISNREDLATAFGRPYFASPFDTGVFVDWRAPNENIAFTSIGGFGLPSRDHYMKGGEPYEGLREDYVRTLTLLLTVAGIEAPSQSARAILDLETQMAAVDWAPELERDPDVTYNKLSWEEFRAMMGDLPIDAYARSASLSGARAILVTEIPPTEAELVGQDLSAEQRENLSQGFPALSRVISETPLDTWKAYLTAHFLIDYADVLPREIRTSAFEMFGKRLQGRAEQTPRPQRASAAVSRAFSDAIGEVYVQRNFPEESKLAAVEMTENIVKAMEDSLESADWMGDDTRAEALKKLSSLTLKIGYPESFKDYSTLQVTDDALQNAIAVKQFDWSHTTSRLGRPVDRTIWFYPTYRVGAYYATAFNEIVFPAAILQAPFFDPAADPAVNYGSVGGIIAHEITHAFDDEGARYDASGLLRNWWSEEDLAQFRKARSRLVEQFDGYCPLDNGETCVNGRLTLGENLADLGGVALAYRAYRASLAGKEPPVLNGYTGDQRFFMAWAQVYRFKVRDEVIRSQLASDPHSPAEYRVNGIVRNLDAWYRAFDIDRNDPMYLAPEERVRLW